MGSEMCIRDSSGIEPAELIRAVRSQDVARLTKIPGVGKKTAERIGLELKDRLPEIPEAPTGSTLEDERRSDLLSALVNLGYQRSGVEKALERTLAELPQGTFEQLLKAVLKTLSRG